MSLPSSVKTVADAITYFTVENAGLRAQIAALQGRATVLESKVPTPIAPPVVKTPAAISSDGTPQVGEDGLGIDPVFERASITQRRWLRGTTALQSAKSIRFTEVGDLIWRVDGMGDDGTPIFSQSTITVGAATPAAATKLLANPAPAEPIAYIFPDLPAANTPVKQVEVASYDIIAKVAPGPWRILAAMNETGTTRVYLEARDSNHVGLFFVVEGNVQNTPSTYITAPISGEETDILIRRTNNLFTVYIGDLETRLFAGASPVDAFGSDADVNRVQIVNFFDATKVVLAASIAPTALVTDRLVLSDKAVTPQGRFTAALQYYIPNDDTLTVEFASLSGETIVPAAPYKVVTNPAAGVATIEAPSLIPLARRGSRVRVISRQGSNPANVDVTEVTFPGDMDFGANLSNLYVAGRARRVFSNMLVQSYWQDSFGTPRVNANGDPVDENDVALNGDGRKQAIDYHTYTRSAAGHVDDLGFPLSARKWLYYPLPDQQNEQVTLQLKWTGGPITINHFGGGPGVGIKQIGAITAPDANTREWTITVDRENAEGLYAGTLEFTEIDLGNLPKNMTLCVKGVDNLTQRFLPSFIDNLKLLTGRLRFMDDLAVNGALTFKGQPFVWADRARQDHGICSRLSPEDMIEIGNRANLSVVWNVNAPMAYEVGGLDYFDRFTDALYKGTDCVFTTPGFTAPSGLVQPIAVEVGNEAWNPGFGGKGTYTYLAHKSGEVGRGVPYDGLNGSAMSENVLVERNWLQNLFMSRIESRISDWRARTIRVLGTRCDPGDLQALMTRQFGDLARLHVDEVQVAPYIPNDPASGGRAADVPDKSPPALCAYLRAETVRVGDELDAIVANTLSYGFSHGIYEVNVSIPSLGLTLAENKALRRSPEYKALWRDHIIPMLARHGGNIALYSDVSNLYPSYTQQWGMEHVPGSDLNQAWDAVVEWTAARAN